MGVAMPPDYRAPAAEAMIHALSDVTADLVDEASQALCSRPRAEHDLP